MPLGFSPQFSDSCTPAICYKQTAMLVLPVVTTGTHTHTYTHASPRTQHTFTSNDSNAFCVVASASSLARRSSSCFSNCNSQQAKVFCCKLSSHVCASSALILSRTSTHKGFHKVQHFVGTTATARQCF